MCLKNVEHGIPKEAKRDIICYKLLYHNEVTNKWSTPFRGDVVFLGALINSELQEARNWYDDGGEIEIGIHSYAKFKDAVKDLYDKWYTDKIGSKYPMVLVRSKIPKGSKYWVGTFCCMKSYCSDQIIYLKVLKIRRSLCV
jgi:hypothetical protein